MSGACSSGRCGKAPAIRFHCFSYDTKVPAVAPLYSNSFRRLCMTSAVGTPAASGVGKRRYRPCSSGSSGTNRGRSGYEWYRELRREYIVITRRPSQDSRERCRGGVPQFVRTRSTPGGRMSWVYDEGWDRRQTCSSIGILRVGVDQETAATKPAVSFILL